jgi:hypothetical protein
MRVLDRFAYLDEQLQPLPRAEAAIVAIRRNGRALGVSITK